MSPPTITVACAHCQKDVALVATAVRRARKQGRKLFCDVKCMGLARIDTARPYSRKRPPVRRGRRHGLSLAEIIEWNGIPEPTTGCSLWLGPLSNNGYGHFRYDNRDLLAHRVAYELAKGPIPDGLFVCHRCDFPPCVNPDHLFPGTHQDNMDDMAAKDRRPIKDRHFASKVDLDLAVQIFQAAGEQRDIGAVFGVSQTTVWKIKTGQHWLTREPNWWDAVAKFYPSDHEGAAYALKLIAEAAANQGAAA